MYAYFVYITMSSSPGCRCQHQEPFFESFYWKLGYNMNLMDFLALLVPKLMAKIL